ncbi:hypothetical protein TMES_09375 [Thalassospira mesophila]|uniref:Uncharacterized protein n=1 Tax=Thalassospira mesophila TaxID=1293891 RepID=A0A1Y2L118_9PROT|nr:hypothetical protein TMES_09375 [Thalassospira mesophila]
MQGAGGLFAAAGLAQHTAKPVICNYRAFNGHMCLFGASPWPWLAIIIKLRSRQKVRVEKQ